MIDGIGEYFKLSNNCDSPKIKIGKEIKKIDFFIEDNEELPKFYIMDNIEAEIESGETLQQEDDIENDIESNNEIIEIGDTQREKYFNTGLMFTNLGLISVFSFTRPFFNVCGYLYWIHALGQFMVTGALGYYTVTYIISDYQEKRNNHYIFIEGDIVWNIDVVKNLFSLAHLLVLFLLIGIGGGMLTTPIMIQVYVTRGSSSY